MASVYCRLKVPLGTGTSAADADSRHGLKEARSMMKSLLLIGVVTMLVIAAVSAVTTAAGPDRVEVDIVPVYAGKPPLAKTWTTGARKRSGLASGCYLSTYEPWLFSSGGQGIRTLNRLPGT